MSRAKEICGAEFAGYGACVAPFYHDGLHEDANGYKFNASSLTMGRGCKPKATLSVAASAVAKLINERFEGMEMDAGFDGGEFSGPIGWGAMQADARRLLASMKWNISEFDRVLHERVSGKWLFFASPFGALELTDDEDWRGSQSAWEARTELSNR